MIIVPIIMIGKKVIFIFLVIQSPAYLRGFVLYHSLNQADSTGCPELAVVYLCFPHTQ
jgi:hypothetical protein